MMDLIDIARLEERRAARGVSEVSQEHAPWLGGRMSRGAPGLWCNVTIGAGLEPGTKATDADVAALIDFYASAGIEPRIELCPLADDSLRAALERAGFVLRMFEMVLVRELMPDERFEPVHPSPADVHYELLDPHDERALRACAEVVIPGFKDEAPRIETGQPTGDSAPVTDEEYEFFVRNARHPRCLTAVARLSSGKIVGVGGCSVREECGGLFGAVTLKAHRRRGIQQGLLAFRMQQMRAGGVKLATIGSRPDSPTQRNVRRMGFWHAYTKVAMVRPGPGLVSVAG